MTPSTARIVVVLPSSVGANESIDLAAAHSESDAVECLARPEGLLKMVDAENRHAAPEGVKGVDGRCSVDRVQVTSFRAVEIFVVFIGEPTSD